MEKRAVWQLIESEAIVETQSTVENRPRVFDTARLEQHFEAVVHQMPPAAEVRPSQRPIQTLTPPVEETAETLVSDYEVPFDQNESGELSLVGFDDEEASVDEEIEAALQAMVEMGGEAPTADEASERSSPTAPIDSAAPKRTSFLIKGIPLSGWKGRRTTAPVAFVSMLSTWKTVTGSTRPHHKEKQHRFCLVNDLSVARSQRWGGVVTLDGPEAVKEYVIRSL